MSDYIIRRAQAEDAAGVGALVRRVWGEEYPHREMYDPEALMRANDAGTFISVAGLDPSGVVVAHDALFRPSLGPRAETCAAMVAPEHRGRGLMSQTRRFVLQIARESGLIGVFGHPVTHHIVSQKVYGELDFTCVGLCLGYIPAKLASVPSASRLRGNVMTCCRILRPRALPALYPPERHAELIRSLYEQLGVITGTPVPPSRSMGNAPIAFRAEADTCLDLTRIDRVVPGSDAEADWDALSCAARGHAVTQLYLPLDCPQTPALCGKAEREGFFFSGLGLPFEDERETVLYQRVREAVCPEIHYADGRAEKVLRYVAAEYLRASGQRLDVTRPPARV